MKRESKFQIRVSIISIKVLITFVFLLTMQSRVFALSIQDEMSLGRQFLREVTRHYEIVDDDFSNTYINELGKYLTDFLEVKHFSFNFYIIKSNDLNAFAGPGGHIFIFTGLINTMSELDEVASVICHEIGHVRARHISERLDQSKKISIATMAGILAGALIGGDAAAPLMYGSLAAGIQKQLSYSREDERQADQLEYKYMAKSGFDPRAMISALQKLEKGLYGATNTTPVYLQTHPMGPERMSNIEAMLSTHSPIQENAQVKRMKKDFTLLQTILKAECLDTHYAEDVFTRNIEEHPDSGLDHLGLGIVLKKRSEYSKSIHHLEASLNNISNPLPVLYNLGESYQLSGQDLKAIEILDRALSIDHNNTESLYLQALSFQNIKEYNESIQLFEKLTSLEPVKDRVFYDLGVSYGRQNILGPAHYNFGIYFMRQGNIKDARYHFQKALDEAGQDPSLKKKIYDQIKSLDKKSKKPF